MFSAIISAFLGGVILNLMPCVFPIISFKIMGLVNHIHDKKRLRKEGLAFMAGVILSMLILSGVLLMLRAGGKAVGWGFQLQSPQFVMLLALVMLGSALNLSGLFEAGLRLQRVGQAQHVDKGISGALLTGMLAILVSTPCAAPFMASAIGYASVQSPLIALTIFLSLALGFATPLTVLSFNPRLSKKLPQPGAWMETLKQFLAFPMYAATAWLVWIIAQQTNSTGLAIVFTCCIAFAMTCWIYGLVQKRALMGHQTWWLYLMMFTLSLSILFLIFNPNSALNEPNKTMESNTNTSTSEKKLTTIKWSPQAFEEAKKQHRTIFINFTASWCITCQANDKNVISTSEVQKALLETNTIYMIADSTKYNSDIVKAMAEYDRDSLPLYIIYPANGAKPIILPQILIKSDFIDVLKKAEKI